MEHKKKEKTTGVLSQSINKRNTNTSTQEGIGEFFGSK
jgi:hypothetical protein